MFETTVELLDRLYVKLDKEKATGFNRDLANEARKRLLQLDHLLKLVRENEAQHDKAMQRVMEVFRQHCVAHQHDFETVPQPEDSKMTGEEMDISRVSAFEMELFTEGFYYISHRLLHLLYRSKPIPGLDRNWGKSLGARIVRNKLLEHPEDPDSQVFIGSFGWGKENGPSLKAARYGGQEKVFVDKGLYINAAEIRDKLETALKGLLK